MKFLLCFGTMLAFVTERALSQQYLLGKLPIQSEGRNFGGLLDPVTTRLSSLETSVAPLTSGLASLQNQVAAFPNQVANLQSQVSPLHSLPNQVATLVTKLTADEALIATNQANIAALQTQLAAAKTDAAQAKTDAAQAKTDAAQAKTDAAQAKIDAAAAKTDAAQAKIDAAAAKTDAAQAKIDAAAAKIDAAAAKTAATTPRCPATVAATGKVIGNFCYTLGSGTKSFTAAQGDCAANGGTLAEPTSSTTVDTSKAFYDSIKSKFDPTFTTAVGANNLWIGLKRAAGDTPFTFQSGATFTTAVANILFEVGGGAALADPAAANKPEGATLKSTGRYSNELQSISANYICQFPAF